MNPVHGLRQGPTRCFNSVADAGGPADVVQQGAAHVAPEIQDYVFRGITLVLVHQLQAPANVWFNDGHARPTNILGVDDLHAHAWLERGLDAVCELRRE